MTWGDLTPIYLEDGRLTADPADRRDVACVALNVYVGSPEKYTAFATPEAYNAMLEYGRMWASLMHRQPRPEDHLFLATKLLPRKASEQAIAKRIQQMAAKAGLRNRDTKKGTRFETQLVHGFRKFFNKTCKEALSGDSLASLIRTEYMMGHTGLVSLDQNYFKTSMLEMAAEYVKVVPDLTIDDADRLRHSNRAMATNIQKMENEKDGKIARLEEQIRQMSEERDAKTAELEGRIRQMSEEKDTQAAEFESHIRRMEDEIVQGRDVGIAVKQILDALKQSPDTGGMSSDLVEALTGMMRQFGIAQETALRDMKAEYDAKLDNLMRIIGLGGTGSDDPLAGFRKDGV